MVGYLLEVRNSSCTYISRFVAVKVVAVAAVDGGRRQKQKQRRKDMWRGKKKEKNEMKDEE